MHAALKILLLLESDEIPSAPSPPPSSGGAHLLTESGSILDTESASPIDLG